MKTFMPLCGKTPLCLFLVCCCGFMVAATEVFRETALLLLIVLRLLSEALYSGLFLQTQTCHSLFPVPQQTPLFALPRCIYRERQEVFLGCLLSIESRTIGRKWLLLNAPLKAASSGADAFRVLAQLLMWSHHCFPSCIIATSKWSRFRGSTSEPPCCLCFGFNLGPGAPAVVSSASGLLDRTAAVLSLFVWWLWVCIRLLIRVRLRCQSNVFVLTKTGC